MKKLNQSRRLTFDEIAVKATIPLAIVAFILWIVKMLSFLI